MSKWIIGILAAVGLALGVYTVLTSGRDVAEPPPAAPPSVNPFGAGIAATGLVEAASRNVAVAPPEPGLVTDVFVAVGEQVAAREPLYALDARPLEAELLQARAAAEVAAARLAQLEAAPRPEQVPIFEARLEAARAEAQRERSEFERTRQVYERGAATEREFELRRTALAAAEARVAEAQAALAELRAGTWEEELAVARSELAQARAQVEALERRIARLTVRSPVTGTVLKRRIEPGEYATVPAPGNEPGLVVGDLSHLHVRAQVDEEDAPRLRAGADAVARVRGPVDVRLPLEMLRIEPFAEPKEQLTGLSTELVDTRVVEVVFRIEGDPAVPVFPGQLVDVFIEANEE